MASRKHRRTTQLIIQFDIKTVLLIIASKVSVQMEKKKLKCTSSQVCQPLRLVKGRKEKSKFLSFLLGRCQRTVPPWLRHPRRRSENLEGETDIPQETVLGFQAADISGKQGPRLSSLCFRINCYHPAPIFEV